MLRTGVILADRYQLDEPIAAGGVGQVWRATDLVLQRPVAVKLLRPEYADHPETLSRFRAEARHAGSLAHPGIAQVYDFGDNPQEGPPYLVMELVDGPSLADVLASEPLTPAYALDVLAGASIGLSAAHEAGLVHRDIKPGNILLGRDGQVKITDFGIAHAIGSAPVTDPGLVMGTTQYLAPERIAGGSGSPAADMYSLGIVMHECLTGVPPYEGTPAEVMAGHLYVPLPPLPAATPPEVTDLVGRLTAKDPEQRLCNASELGPLAQTVRAQISGETMPRQRQPSAMSPVGGVAAPEGLANSGPIGSLATERIPAAPPSAFPQRPASGFPAPPPNGFVGPMASAYAEPPAARTGVGLGPDLNEPAADAAFAEGPAIDSPYAGTPPPGNAVIGDDPQFASAVIGDPGTGLALRDPGALAVREPGPADGTARTGGIPELANPLGETSIDLGAPLQETSLDLGDPLLQTSLDLGNPLLETSLDIGGPVQETSLDLGGSLQQTSLDLGSSLQETSLDLGSSMAPRGPRTIHGIVADASTDPFATEQAFTGGHARPHLRHTGEMIAAERSRSRRRRAAIGIGVLLLAGGAGLTGAAASGALRTSPVADRTNVNAAHPGLSAVEPNTGDKTPGNAAAHAKHSKPYTARHAKSANHAPSHSAAPVTPPSSASQSNPAPAASTPATQKKPAPSPSGSGNGSPPSLLGIPLP